jgi:RNA polymerase sigma-70 factor (ECF subfamily)
MDHHKSAVFPGRPTPHDFPGIVDAFGAPSMALAVNILGNHEDAEDACQEAFLQVFRNLDRFDNRAGFQTWLYTILYRRCLDVIRKRKRTFRLYARARAEHVRTAENPRSRGPADKPLDEALLNRLNAKERTALSLWANEGYTAEEISRVIHTSASTARVHLFQARKKLKTVLERNHEALQNS